MTRLSRPCYDKPHRCPGWAGGGLKYARVDRCPQGGRIRTRLADPDFDDEFVHPAAAWWLPGHCNRCDVVTLPWFTRWLDPSTWRAIAERLVRRARWAFEDRLRDRARR